MPARLTAAQYARLQGRPRAPRKPRNTPLRQEAAVQRQCLAWLSLRGLWHQRMNAGAVMAGGRPFRAARAGTADVLVVHRGHAYFVEFKSATGRQRQTQRAFQQAVERAGATYWIVRGLGELVEAFAREGIE